MSLASSLNVGVSALRAYSSGIQTISNNIANVNTVGYKASHAQYADSFSDILRPMVPNEKGDAAKIAPTQVGGGVQVEAVAPVFSQGTIQITNSSSDLAIAGNGFFLVRNPQTQQLFVTRAGNFRVDASGTLVTQQGFRVQGSYNAFTKVVYDTVTGGYNVKGPQDNYQVVIPANTNPKTVTGGFSATTAGSKELMVTADAVKGLSTGMPISAGTKIAAGTVIQEIKLDVNPPKIVLNKGVLNKIEDTDEITLGSKSLDSQSHNIVLPVDYMRPDITKGMPLIGAGIKPGTVIADPGSAGNLKFTIPASASLVAGVAATYDNLLSGGTDKNRLCVPSISGISKGMVITNFGGPLDKMVVSDMGTYGSQAWIEVKKYDSAGVLTTPDLSSANPAAMSAVSLAGPKTLDKSLSYFYLSSTEASSLQAGDPISGEGIPLGTKIGSSFTTTPDAVTGLVKIPLVDGSGNAVYPNTDSYASVRLAFKNQSIDISEFPTTDSYENVTVSLGDSYRPAAQVGDVRISFNESDGKMVDPTAPPDYTFVGTDGKPLDGITLQAARANAPKIRTFNVGTSGAINIVLSNGQTFTSGAVLLQSFKDPGALTREGDNLFSGLLTAGPYNGLFNASNISSLTPGNGGLGVINGGALELSNVDLGEEFSAMITTQRAFQAGSRVITTTDQMLEEAVNLKR